MAKVSVSQRFRSDTRHSRTLHNRVLLVATFGVERGKDARTVEQLPDTEHRTKSLQTGPQISHLRTWINQFIGMCVVCHVKKKTTTTKTTRKDNTGKIHGFPLMDLT